MSEHLSSTYQASADLQSILPTYQTVFDGFGLGTILVAENGGILSSTGAVAEDLGYTCAQLKGKRLFEINPHLSLIDWKRLWKKLRKGEQFELETEHITAEEMLFPVRLHGTMIRGEEPRCLIGVNNLMHTHRYRKLLDLTTKVGKVGGWEWDLVHDSLAMTDEIYKLLSLKKDERQLEDKASLQALMEERLQPADIELINQHFRSAIETGEPVRFEFTLHGRNGGFRQMAVTAVPEKTELQTIKLYGTLQDISDLAERNEDLYLTQYSLDHAREMIFWETEEGSFLYSNEAVRQLLGYSQKDMRSMSVHDLVYDYDSGNRAEHWEHLRQAGDGEIEVELIAKDGSIIPTYCSMSLINYRGREINCVFARDWRRKKARDERLRLSQFTLDNAVDMIFWMTSEGNIAYANQTAYEKLGNREFNHWDELFPKIDISSLQEASGSSGIDHETELKTIYGYSFPVSIHFDQVSFEGKDYSCAFVRDVSVLHRKNRELENALQEVSELTEKLERENTLLKEEIELNDNFENIITQDERYRNVLRQIEQVAHTNATVLIVGETGTGKELLARSIRRLSKRKDSPMIKVNCAALPKDLIESELFGHERGAFTGAHQLKKGRFELADDGTIFLDEVGEMPLSLQSKLLRVLQEGEFERVGGTETLEVDVRVIAATNRDLMEMVSSGEFREDLYYRLNVFPIHNIPLRERREDIPLLVRFFVEKYSKKTGKQIEQIPPAALDRLMQYEFPGNIRELENIVERAVILSPGKTLNLQDSFQAEARGERKKQDTFKSFEEMQREYIIEALRRCNWRISGPKGAATMLELNSRTLASKMRRLGIRRQDFIS